MSKFATRSVVAALVLVAGLAGSVSGFQPTGAYDPATGRDLRNYPRHAVADFLHMKLNILVPDMNQPRMEIVQELSFAPIGTDLDSLKLDAKLMDIHSVTSPGREVKFEHDGQSLRIDFDPPVPAGHACTITTIYTVNNPPFGVAWTPESPEWPGRAAQMHTKGAPENNSYWFPCHDFPNDRLTTEIIATVPAAYDVVSNGRMVEEVKNKVMTSRESGEKTKPEMKLAMYRQFHWLQEKPHAPYLVVLAIGQWDVVNVGTKTVPMPVYAPKGRGGDVKASFGRTAQMVDFFGQVLHEPYPWDQYAQVVVWNFSSGGMENTGATTLTEGAIYSPEGLADSDPDGLVSHESAHQWFGDLITCNSWEHTWLNEGWATYCESLWFDHRDGPTGYEAQIIREFDGALSRDKADAPRQPGMVSKEYRLPSEVFGRAANPYSKGASILHMLRKRIGDDAFFRGTKMYIDRWKFKQPETADFQEVMEEASGESLDQFFWQWCYRPGHPDLDVNMSWDSAVNKLAITLAQTQHIDGPNPAFEFDLPILIGMADGKTRSQTIPVHGKAASLEVELPAEPRWVAIDPEMTVLAKVKLDEPGQWLGMQAHAGPTLASRIQALRALGSDGGDPLTREVGTVTAQEILFKSDTHEILRVEAAKTLRVLGAEEVLESCAAEASNPWEVREATVEAMATAAAASTGDDAVKERAAEVLARIYNQDKSAKVRAACIRGLGKLKSTRHLPLILSAASVESQSDRVRQAALAVLGDMDAPEGFAPALKYTGNAGRSRTRPAAMDALVKLGKQDPNETYEALSEAFASPDQRARAAAARSLVDLKDPRGLALLEQARAQTRDYQMQVMLDGWIKDLRESMTSGTGGAMSGQ